MTIDVVVVGGGIAGTVTAIALHKAGLTPVVHEAYERDADERGAFLTIGVNGLQALRVLDMDPTALAGHPTPTMALANGAGRHLGDLPLGGPTPDGISSTTIRRADLYAALRAEAHRRGIDIRYGKRLVSVQHAGGGVTAEFADGSRVAAALLVGADGLHSRTREVLNPGGPRPRYLGLLNAGGFTGGPVDGVAARPGVVHMTFGRGCFFGFNAAPDGTIWWFANPPQRRPTTPGDRDPVRWRARLLRLVAGDASPAAAIIAATDEVLGPWNTYDLPRVPIWHDDRIVLVGDAAHAVAPSSGQGASMAVEDAVTLATCLRDTRAVPEALQRYERLRRPRVQRVVAYGRRTSSTKVAGPVAGALRDAMTPLVLRMLYRKGNPQAWILDHRISWEPASG
jgi:2-polyprenyl-6-methoxyphenol hydroxylase-like FAD-dependent oxidoreductase